MHQVDSKQKLLRYLQAFFMLAGLFLSLYSAYHHYQFKLGSGADFSCNINSLYNCDAIAASSYAEFFSVPWGIWGFAYFLALLYMSCTPWFRWLLLFGNFLSIGFLYLSFTSLSSLCVVCLGIHSCNFILLALSVAGHRLKTGDEASYLSLKKILPLTKKSIFQAFVGIFILALSLLAYRFFEQAKPIKSEAALNLDASALSKELIWDKDQVELAFQSSAYKGNGQDFYMGPLDAKVTLVEFADFECPACASISLMLKELLLDYKNRVLFVFKNYPLDRSCNPGLNFDMHHFACEAALAARCAGQYEAFWPFFDLVFRGQDKLSSGSITAWLNAVGVQEPEWQNCKKEPMHLAKIKEDLELGSRANVSGTPTIFINGHKLFKNDAASLRLALDHFLSQH